MSLVRLLAERQLRVQRQKTDLRGQIRCGCTTDDKHAGTCAGAVVVSASVVLIVVLL